MTFSYSIICKLSQFVSQAMDVHLQAAPRILNFIKQAPAQGLLFKIGFTYLDWRSCHNTIADLPQVYAFILVALSLAGKARNRRLFQDLFQRPSTELLHVKHIGCYNSCKIWVFNIHNQSQIFVIIIQLFKLPTILFFMNALFRTKFKQK